MDKNSKQDQYKKYYVNKGIYILLFILISTMFVIGFYGYNSDYYTSSQINLFLLINDKLSILPTFWLNVTTLGDILILFLLLSFLIFKNIQAWAALIGAIPFAVMLAHLSKQFFATPRPASIIDADKFTVIGDILSGHTSLPSGHTITIFATLTAILLVLIYKKETQYPILLGLILMLLASIIAISRVAVGAHWPADLVLGAIFGIFAGCSGAFFTFKHAAWWQWMTMQKYRYVHIIILLILSIFMMLEYYGLVLSWLSLAIASFVLISLINAKSTN